MRAGENVKALIDYDLFGHNVNGQVGIYIKTYKSKKCLVYFPQFEEWAELPCESLKCLTSDNPTPENLDFVSRIKKMVYTCPT